jgi:SH3-like domain-containing protein
MKSGPDHRSQDLKQIYPGYKLLILDEIEGWMKVRTIDREEGWVLPEWIKLIDVES